MKITRDTVHNFKFYKVAVGYVKDEEPEVYLVVNKDNDVVEFSHEVLPFVLEWIKHFEKRLQDILDGKTPDEDDVNNIVRSMN